MSTSREKFFILSLPRSRSKWLSEFLSFAGRRCGHDLVVECSSQEDFARALEPLDGTCETGAVLGWKVLRARYPQARFLTVHRPVLEVYQSLLACGVPADLNDLMLKEQMLLACAQSPGMMSVTFDQLASFEICGTIFAHCLDLGLEHDYWAEFAGRNIQINMVKRMERLRVNAISLSAFRQSIARAQIGVQSWGQN